MEKTRQLLDKFYSGETSPAENKLIASLLTEEDDGDKALFDALATAELATEVPPELEADIRGAISNLQAKRRIAPMVWVKAAGIAAAVAVIALCWAHFNEPGDIQQPAELIAEVHQIPVTAPKPKPKAEVISQEIVIVTQEPAKPKARKTPPEMPTDEELLAAEASLRLLGEKINEASIKAAAAAEQIQNNNSLKNILK